MPKTGLSVNLVLSVFDSNRDYSRVSKNGMFWTRKNVYDRSEVKTEFYCLTLS